MNPNAPEFQPPSLTSQNDKSRSGKLATRQDIKSSQQKSKKSTLRQSANKGPNALKNIIKINFSTLKQEEETKERRKHHTEKSL